MKIALVALLAFPFSTLALDPNALNEASRLLEGAIQVEPQVDCFDPAVTPSCGTITQTYCQNLSTNEGRITDSQGTVNIGRSERSQISALERAGLEDLVRAHYRLPDDLKNELRRPIERLRSLLESENDSRSWYRSISSVRNQIAEEIEDVAQRRARTALAQRFTNGRSPKRADRDAERDHQFRLANDQVTEARMESSPNWPRLLEVFGQVKRDMLSVVQTLPLTEQEKRERIQRINDTDLTTPFAVRLGGRIGDIIEDDCRSNMVNAFFNKLNQKLTVCAGLMNGFQSENAMYFTLAHELAHSFNLNQLQNASSQPKMSRLNDRLLSTNGNIPCEEYRALRASEVARSGSYECGRDSYNQFMSCLIGNHETNHSIVAGQTLLQSRALIRGLNLCQITNPDQGEAYMNPNIFADRNFARLVSSGLQEYAGPALSSGRAMMIPAYQVTQEVRCKQGEENCENTIARLLQELPSTIENPPQCLVNSESGEENESDWYAHKAMLIRLRGLPDIRARREMIASSLGLFCGFSYMRPLTNKQERVITRELEEIARNATGGSDNHSSNGNRLTGVMTEEVASLLQCSRPETPAGSNYQSCQL